MRPGAASARDSARDAEEPGRGHDPGRDRSRSLAGWLGARLSKTVSRVRTLVTASARSVRASLSRAAAWLRDQAGSPVRLARSLVTAAIGKDHGFGFWWLVATAAIALGVGLLVAALLSPVIGLIAALVVGIWMLVRRSRSPHSPKRAGAALAN